MPKIEVGRHDRQSQMRVSHILKSLGMEKQEKRKISGKVSQFWGKVATRSQPGRNQVATEVATYSNPCREGDTEKRLLPFKEKTTETFPENKSVVIHSEIYSKETLDIGSNPKVATSPETVIQQGLEAVATPVATSEENYDIHEANAELIRSAESYEQIKALAEEWDKSFKQQVWGCLNERDRKRIAELKVSSRECPKAADEEPIYRDEQAIQSAFIKLQSSIRSQTLDWSAREIATDLLAKAYEKLDPLEQAAFRIWEDAQSDRDEED
ncbi:MAG: hypothetical protein HC903_11075 [Methylacidiphilales bacterium]|nr:hypothetical protein [Candidatus Methylacidiphilales bacterium]